MRLRQTGTQLSMERGLAARTMAHSVKRGREPLPLRSPPRRPAGAPYRRQHEQSAAPVRLTPPGGTAPRTVPIPRTPCSSVGSEPSGMAATAPTAARGRPTNSRRRGLCINHKRVKRLMRCRGLAACPPGRVLSHDEAWRGHSAPGPRRRGLRSRGAEALRARATSPTCLRLRVSATVPRWSTLTRGASLAGRSPVTCPTTWRSRRSLVLAAT